MSSAEVIDELEAYRDVLRKGKLTELDLDALGNCLGEAIQAMNLSEVALSDSTEFRRDIVNEIRRLEAAVDTLKSGSCAFSDSGTNDELAELNAVGLIYHRDRARERFASVVRSGERPLKTAQSACKPSELEDFRIENGRI